MSASRKIPQSKRTEKTSAKAIADNVQKPKVETSTVEEKKEEKKAVSTTAKKTEQGESKKQATFMLPISYLKRLKMLSVVEERKQGELVTEAMEMLFKKYKG